MPWPTTSSINIGWQASMSSKTHESVVRPTIVCLCGSTRFGDAFREAMRSETLDGKIVLTVGLLGHAEGIDMDGPVKAMLDRLHLAKIDLADEVLILNVGGYIGSSTRNELAHARAKGKVIRWLEPFASDFVPSPTRSSSECPPVSRVVSSL